MISYSNKSISSNNSNSKSSDSKAVVMIRVEKEILAVTIIAVIILSIITVIVVSIVVAAKILEVVKNIYVCKISHVFISQNTVYKHSIQIIHILTHVIPTVHDIHANTYIHIIHII